VCPSVRGSRTTRRVRRSSDNWGDTPGVMPHNPEGASLHPIDGVARAPARTALPEGCVKPETRGGAHNQKRAYDRGARPKGCFTHKPDARHQRNCALKKTGRTTRRVSQPQKTRRRVQPTACARRGSTTQRVLHPQTLRAAPDQVGAKKPGRTTRRMRHTQARGAVCVCECERANVAHNPKGASDRSNPASACV